MQLVIGIHETGIVHTTNKYGKPYTYDNIYLHTIANVFQGLEPEYRGFKIEEIKISKAIAKLYGVNDWKDLLGHIVEFSYIPSTEEISKVIVIDKNHDGNTSLSKIQSLFNNPEITEDYIDQRMAEEFKNAKK